MSTNPFEAPKSDGVDSQSREAANLYRIARYQKAVLLCLVLQILFIITRYGVPRSIFITAEINMLFLAMGSLFITLASAVFVYLLAASVYSTAVGILLGVLALLPCINLIMLLIVNGKATSVLRAHGIKVGLLGAKL